MVGSQLLQDARRRALADGDAAGQADDVWAVGGQRAEERVGDDLAIGRRHCVQAEQPRQREVDVGDLVEIEPLVDAADLLEVLRTEIQRRVGTQLRPVTTVEDQFLSPHGRRSFPSGVGFDEFGR